MTTVFDLEAEFDKLAMLKGRTPQSTGDQHKDSSAQVAPYRDGSIFAMLGGCCRSWAGSSWGSPCTRW